MEELKLIITMSPSGSVSVTGPIANKAICYGMLEAAKDAIREYVEKNKSVIVPAPAMPGLGNGQGH